VAAKTITFAVQIGSRGYEIARHVAEDLQYRYYDWEVTSQAAREAGVSPETIAASEQTPRGFKRIIERLFTAGAFVHDDATMEGPNAATMEAAIRALNVDDYRSFIENVVLDLGTQGGGVIVGHAGQLVLQDEPGVLKVLVCGSQTQRAASLSIQEGLTPEKALAAVQNSDRDRLHFFKQVYRIDLLDATLYDLTLNTDHLSTAQGIKLVLEAAEGLLVPA
jgi:cytidylate kinase